MVFKVFPPYSFYTYILHEKPLIVKPYGFNFLCNVYGFKKLVSYGIIRLLIKWQIIL